MNSQNQLTNNNSPSDSQMRNTSNPRRPRLNPIRWNTQMEEAMLNALIDAQTQGLQTDNAAYKSAGWQMALDAVQECTLYTVQLQQIKSKHDAHKKDWKAWKEFCNQSGFGWDSEKGVPTASPEVLEAYFETHPQARKFREKPLAFADKLAILLDGHLATGENASTVEQLLADTDNNEISDYESSEGEIYDWSQSPTPGPSHITPGSSRTRPSASLTSNLRKRTLESTTQAKYKKRKTGAHSLADTISDAIQELSSSRDAWIEANQTSSQKVASILVSEEFNLNEEEQDTVFSAIKNSDKIDLFLARTKDMQKQFIDRILTETYSNREN
jgi:hypothetical protein